LLRLLAVALSVVGIAAPVWAPDGPGKWTTVECTGSPTARHEDSVVTVNGKLYLLGGRGIKPVEEFDPATKTWRQLGPTPLEIHHFQPVVYKGLVYVMSAMTGEYPKELPLDHIYVFDPKQDSWTKGPEIPKHRRRGSTGTVVYQDKIYLAAGITFGHTSGTNAWFDEFDPATGQWRELADAPTIRDHFPAVLVGDKMYLIGGRNTSYHEDGKFTAFFGATTPEVDVYDFTAGKWETLAAPLPVPTAAGGLVELGGKIFYMGGETAQDLAHAETQRLDPKTGEWTMMAPLERGRHGTGAVVIGDKIYTAAGSGGRGGGPELALTEVFTP
jgi:N-acetylneuraminic acid mutarotase